MTGAERSPRRLPRVHERPWAVGAYLACAALVGVAWAAPLASVLGSVTGAYPRGDAELFDPGGLMLLEALQRTEPAGPALSAASIATAIVALFFGLVVLAFALAQLGTPGRSRPSWALARAVRVLPPLALVALVALLAHVVVIALLMIAGGAISRSAWPIPPPRDIARLVLLGLVAVASMAVSAMHDLARAAAVTGPSGTYASLRAAVLVVGRSPLRVAWSFAWRLVAGLAAIGVAFAAGLAIGERAPAAIVASALVHQIGLAAAGWCRLSWLARAAHLVRPVVYLTSKRSKPAPAPAPASEEMPANEGVSVEGAAAIEGVAMGGAAAIEGVAMGGAAAIEGVAMGGAAVNEGVTMEGAAAIEGVAMGGAAVNEGVTMEGAAANEGVSTEGTAASEGIVTEVPPA